MNKVRSRRKKWCIAPFWSPDGKFMGRSSESIEQFLQSRNVRLRSGLTEADVVEFCGSFEIPKDSFLLNLFRRFNGFMDDFDEKTLFCLWSTQEVAEFVASESKVAGRIPFMDVSFRSDIYYVDIRADEGSEILWSRLGSKSLNISVEEFFCNWINGDYDYGVGVPIPR
jgi:hypothetical protein